MIAYTLLAWVLFGVGMAISGGSIDQAVALMAPGGSVRYVALAAIVILTVWLYVRSNRIAGLPSPIPAAPIAVALAAIALAAEFLQSQLQIALPLSSVQSSLPPRWRRPSCSIRVVAERRRAESCDAQSSGLKR